MNRSIFLTLALTGFLASRALADPCGMVPPIYLGDGPPIVRVGDQNTYVFYKDGVETFVIRPGFSGKVEDFGMLIPFPTPPAIRKVPEEIFAHVAAAIDPPEVVVDLRPVLEEKLALFSSRSGGGQGFGGLAINKDEVRVLKEEAIGMYEVAVLEAGSSAALKKWMEEHKYKYPEGMDQVADDYVELRWCFVAVKTKVGGKAEVDPMPGAREVKHGLPNGATFDGHVQAMGFRFETEKLVVPMRLGAFNLGELHNVVYLLTDKPQKIRSIPEEYVVRQVSGEDLFRNVTEPLPLRIIGGSEADIPEYRRNTLPQERNPEPHNGAARDLFAGDLLAIARDRLANPHEEHEKQLLRIGEHFALRGGEIDKLNLDALAADRKQATQDALDDLKKMTLTVIDGDFPREVLSSQNLEFGEYRMPARRNKAEFYDAKTKQPAGKQEGVLKLGSLSPRPAEKQVASVGSGWQLALAAMSLCLALVFVGLCAVGRRP